MSSETAPVFYFVGDGGKKLSVALPPRQSEVADVGYAIRCMFELTTKKKKQEHKPKHVSISLLYGCIKEAGFDSALALQPDIGLQRWMKNDAPGMYLSNFQKIFALGRDDMTSFLEISPKTLLSRAESKHLPFTDAERLTRYMKVWLAASETFEDADYAKEWMHKPNEALGGDSPFELLQGSEGERAVLNELGRIEHGLPI